MSRRIFISGLTAAGKTTHARLLSQTYQLEYISASSRLLSELDINVNTISPDFWINEKGEEVKKKRLQNRATDISVDKQLRLGASQIDTAVFDAWGLPWLSDELGLRIWLESSVKTRCWKSYISHGAIGEYNHKEYELRNLEKDNFSRDYFLSTYGFDLFIEHEVFDYKVDISQFISAPTLEASWTSVSICQNIISAIVECYFEPSLSNIERLTTYLKKFGTEVFQRVPPSIASGDSR